MDPESSTSTAQAQASLPPALDDQPIASTSAQAMSPSPTPASADQEVSLAVDDSADAPMSKKAIKRAARTAAMEATKAERRLKERTGRRERKAAQKADADAGINVEEFNQQKEERLQKRLKEARFDNMNKQKPGTFFNARIIIDLGFDELMADTEIKSLPAQLAYLYNAHRHSHTPFRSLLYTHLDKRLAQRMDHSFWKQASGRRWVGTEWWDGKELDELWNGDAPKKADLTEEEMMEALNEGTSEPQLPISTPSLDTPPVSFSPVLPTSPDAPHPADLVTHLPSRSARENVVYLTADSPNEIDSLEEGMTYVIGGIVDHNRYKSLCLNKALSPPLQIKTARLPIGKYLSSLPTRKVLTVNQVFEILTLWVETRDWTEALKRVVPERKMTQGKRKREGSGEAGGEGGKEDGVDGDEGDEEGAREGEVVVTVGETEEEEEARLNG